MTDALLISTMVVNGLVLLGLAWRGGSFAARTTTAIEHLIHHDGLLGDRTHDLETEVPRIAREVAVLQALAKPPTAP